MEKLYDALNSGVLEDLKMKSSIKELSDAIAFSGEANAALNKLRKTEFKKTMPAKFHKLCTESSDRSSSLLFGDNLLSKVKEANEVSKLIEELRPSRVS